MTVERMPEDVDNSLMDADIYLNTTDRQINALFKDNYDLLSVTLNHILDRKSILLSWFSKVSNTIQTSQGYALQLASEFQKYKKYKRIKS